MYLIYTLICLGFLIVNDNYIAPYIYTQYKPSISNQERSFFVNLLPMFLYGIKASITSIHVSPIKHLSPLPIDRRGRNKALVCRTRRRSSSSFFGPCLQQSTPIYYRLLLSCNHKDLSVRINGWSNISTSSSLVNISNCISLKLSFPTSCYERCRLPQCRKVRMWEGFYLLKWRIIIVGWLLTGQVMIRSSWIFLCLIFSFPVLPVFDVADMFSVLLFLLM